MEEFRVKTKIVSGQGWTQHLSGRKRVLVVTDRFMAKSGKVSVVTAAAERHGAQTLLFSDVCADPDVETVTAGVTALLSFMPDCVAAFGGGSAIDAAKAILFFAKKQQPLPDTMFLAIPTTSGTGSEVSRFAVITDHEKEIKYPLVDDQLLPDIAVLDSQFTVSVPPSVTADTGIDVFTHAIEAYVCTARTDFTDAMAESAIRLVYQNLLTAYRQPDDLEARQKMHNASCMAGIAFSNAGLGLNHGMAHALGARFHIPHGRANGILLPYVMSFNAGCHDKLTPTATRYAQAARLLYLDGSSVRQSALQLIRTLRRFMEKLNMPSTIHQAGADRADFEDALDTMAEAALADRCTAANPRECTCEDIKNIYRQAFTGRSV